MIHIVFYTTQCCHLCDLADSLLSSFKTTIKIEQIDIADDDALMNLYGTRIPVLLRQDTSAELNWPFTVEDIQQFLTDSI